jgi:hypothetical protein
MRFPSKSDPHSEMIPELDFRNISLPLKNSKKMYRLAWREIWGRRGVSIDESVKVKMPLGP